MTFIDRTGEKHITNEGYEIEIIECFGRQNCTIRFECGFVLKYRHYKEIKNGNIKNPYHKSVHGVGCIGVGPYKKATHIKSYKTWSGMLERCYCEKSLFVRPTYIGCSVDERWHDFQNFSKWFEENYIEGYQLDKDILFKGNKIYGPDTCDFVPHKINSLFVRQSKNRGDLPIGVTYQKNNKNFTVYVNKANNSRVCYRGIKTSDEAFLCYKEEKEQYIKEVADEWKDRISHKIYVAMYNYPVEITD